MRRLDARIGRLVTDDLGAPVTHTALSHDGECLLAACTDDELCLLDRASGKLLARYRGHAHASTRVECGLTPSDAHVFAASEDGACLFALWQVCLWLCWCVSVVFHMAVRHQRGACPCYWWPAAADF